MPATGKKFLEKIPNIICLGKKWNTSIRHIGKYMYIHTRDLAIENLILFVEKIHYPKGIFKYSLIYSLGYHRHKYKGISFYESHRF